MLVSPAFQRDRTIVCVHRAHSAAQRVLAVSRDRGKTWRTPSMTGVVRPPDLAGIPLTAVLSPAFGTDRTLVVSTGSGTFVSNDLGETFTPVDALATGGSNDDNPVAFLAPPLVPPGGTPAAHLAYANTRGAAIIDVAARVRRPALGVPGLGAIRFLVPSTAQAPAGALALVNMPGTVPGTDRLAVYRCDAALTCTEPLFSFPPGVVLSPGGWVRLLPDGSVAAFLARGASTPALWRSTDGGRTFARWASADVLVAAADVTGGAPARVALATGGRSQHWYLRVEKARPGGGWPEGAPPASQVFRSDDAGQTWRRVAHALGLGQPGKRGNLPWVSAGRGATIAVAPDGRLLADGSGDALTTYCSVDGGRRWTVGCR
jgi:hypothetical protein